MGLSGERDSDSGSGRDLRVVCLSLVLGSSLSAEPAQDSSPLILPPCPLLKINKS